MTRRKKGPAPKRKPVVRRVGTKEERAQIAALEKQQWDACIEMEKQVLLESRASIGQLVPPSRWSRVVAWVRENPLESTLVAGWLALTAAIVAVLP